VWIKTLIFDLDGTLVDSAPGIRNSFVAAFKDLGLKAPTHDQIEIGPPIAQSLKKMLHPFEERYDEALMAYRKHYAESGVYKATFYPGVRELLSKFAERKINLVVATAKLTKFAKLLLKDQGADDLFKGQIFGSGPAGELSDKAELLKFVIRELKLDAATSFMIGDRKHDMIAANKNNMPSIGVKWGYGSSEELLQAGANHIVSTPQELEQLVWRA
jgi:phosphoglycolate phosphatase